MSVPSVLVELERAAQARADRETVDMADPSAGARLRQIVGDSVAEWSADARRGRRPFDLADPAGVADRVFRNLAGYGPLEPLLADPDVWEIMVNSPDDIFVKRHSGPCGYHDEAFHDDAHVLRTLTKLLDDAGGSHRKLDPSEGLQDAQLPDGARVHIVHSDLTRGGHVVVNIRKFTGVPYSSLDQLVALGSLPAHVARFLATVVRGGASTVFAGAPGAGKTTLLSCCAAELDPAWRVVMAEEVLEADVPLPNVASLQTRPARADREAVDLRRLVSGFLRMAPDVAIVGEVRDREALPLLLTLSSGVSGLTTIHAGSARQALTRLRFICQLADGELPQSALTALVTDTVDLVVHSARDEGAPRVDEVLAVEDLTTSADSGRFTVTEIFARQGPADVLSWTGEVPVRLGEKLRRRGFDLRDLLRPAEPAGSDGALAGGRPR